MNLENDGGTEKFVLTLALNLTFSPGEKEQHRALLVLRMRVRQIPSREFSRERRTILLLLGEKAGLREGMAQTTFARRINLHFDYRVMWSL